MMVRRKIQFVGICASGVALMLAIGPGAMGQPMPAQESESESADTETEHVDYRKKSVIRLRREFNSAEENFYDLFNAVNSDKEFDVECKNETPLGGRRKVHACKAAFLWKYESDVAAQFNDQMTGVRGSSIPDNAQLENKQVQLRDRISMAISEYPEIQQSFAILARAKKDYDAKLQDQ